MYIYMYIYIYTYMYIYILFVPPYNKLQQTLHNTLQYIQQRSATRCSTLTRE